MATLYSAGPGQTTVVNLSQNGFLRISIGPVNIGTAPGLAIIAMYPPGKYENQLALLRIPVGVASDIEEVRGVADVALAMGDREDDKQRIQEAYQLFKNNARAPSQTAMEEAIKLGQSLVDAYWDIQDWIMNTERGRLLIQLENQKIIGEA
ncbi:MAG: hypothetical protein F6K48_02925 [Okeania sp. SIO3H1]|nr:hypothetical protein [Okeania sp. SIO3H1]